MDGGSGCRTGTTSRLPDVDALSLGAALALGAALGAIVVVSALSRRERRLRHALAQATAADDAAPPPGDYRDPIDPVLDRMRERLRQTRAERQVRDLILSSMQEGVLLFEPTGHTAFANPAAEQLLGGRPISAERLVAEGLRDVARRARDGDVARAEVAVGERWLRAAALRTAGDQVLVVLQDVTETKRVEAIRRDFVANASHELKTPAASIQAAAETIRNASTEDPSVVPRFAEQLERDALRLSRIVSDLLDLSRLESGSDLAERVALDAVVREEAARFEEPAAAAGLTLAVEFGRVPPVAGASRDLALLVRNLIDNAIRYTKPGGRVDIAIAGGDGVAKLTVRDTGVGIPTRDIPRVFERFYRVDRARSRETGGTGLGLSIVKHVAENHGGSVEVESELGRGTTVVVRLPAA